jgi:hypothetical protein
MLWDVFGNRRGSISVLSALAIFAVIGFSALALEFGHGLLRRVENQRIADISAYGGALVFNSTSSTTTAGFAAQNLASLNGLTSSAANPSVVNSPTGDGNQAVQVTVTTSDPLLLAAVLTTSPTLSVSATSYAELKANAPGCIIALSNSGTGVTVNGGATVSAPNCAVASNSTVTAHACSNTITTAAIDYNSSTAPSPTCALQKSGGGTPPISKATTTDPLAGNTEVTGATSRISTVSSITSPSAPTVPSGSAVSFTKTSVTGLPSACSDVYNASTKVYAVTCAGTANFGTITLSGVTVTVNTSAGNTYNFNQSWPIAGLALAGSGGTYGFGAGISTSGTTTFPAGTYNMVGGITRAAVQPRPSGLAHITSVPFPATAQAATASAISGQV